MWTRTYSASPPGGATLGLGRGRGADVARRVGGGLALAVDRVELLVRVAREDEVVVEQVVVAPVEAEVEDDPRAGRLVAAAAARTARRRRCRRAARGGSAPSRRSRRRPPARPARRRRSRPRRRRPAASSSIERTAGPGPELDAQLAGQARQRLGHGAGAAARIPDALAGLHVGDPAEHGRRGVGGRADVLREVVEHLRHARLGHVRRGPSPPPCSHGRIFSTSAEHRRAGTPSSRSNMSRSEPIDRQKKKRSEMSLERLGEVEEPAVARRRPPAGANASSAAAIASASAWRSRVEPSSKNDRHCGSSGTRSSSSSRSRPASAKIRGEHRRHQQDGRPHVEPEALRLEHGGLAAEPVVLLEQDDLVAPRRQRAGRRQAAQPAADHADPTRPRSLIVVGLAVIDETHPQMTQMSRCHVQPSRRSRSADDGQSTDSDRLGPRRPAVGGVDRRSVRQPEVLARAAAT